MLSERWRKPAEVLSVEEADDPHQGIWLPDGRRQAGVQLVLSPETIERMRLGHMCVKCMEPFEEAWPVRCPVCGSPVRDKQAEYFEQEYAGATQLGPSTSLDDGGIRERAEREGRS